MAVFNYKARTADGTVVSSSIEAAERRLAMQRLQAQGLSPITLKESSHDRPSFFAKLSERSKALTNNGPSQEQTKASTKQRGSKREHIGLTVLKRLMELHSSGLPIGDSIRILSQRLSDKEQRGIVQTLWRDLSEGSTLAGAMSRQPRYFPNSISYVIEAGEATGNLAPILRKVIDYLEEKEAIRKKMIASMMYPTFICTVAIAVVVLFMTVLLPQIQGMLDRLGGEMTWSARILIDGSSLIAQLGPFLLIGAVIAALLFRQWRRTKAGLQRSDKWLLKLPLLGKIFLYSDLFQVGNLISTLLESGINTTETLRLTERTVKNSDLKERFNIARSQVNEGLSIAQAFQRNNFMPDLAADILTVGENTGNLAHSMNEVTKGFRNELTSRLSQLTTLVSTGALICAFVLVALIALGIVTSVFQVSRTLS
ncbi:type II secretion system F family protein [Coraliomargarita sp. SDUM461004]|uniref:Type II secretion system F family protein n=1 Tax=Thalassobacterium sedimentorum TaxID=3041258 RepID=A0ABU1AHX5_9BACT|nr:type II secretion system F family protein [Coraliomargarita sp. SDUM461004]MDQ8194371.1 type II secretion system F family protein [Coraliomargarita sp. SDUM461004]